MPRLPAELQAGPVTLRRWRAADATDALTTAAFASLPEVERVEIHVDEANHVSAKVPAKLGFRADRREERARVAPGQSGTFVIWVMHRHEWERRPKA